MSDLDLDTLNEQIKRNQQQRAANQAPVKSSNEKFAEQLKSASLQTNTIMRNQAAVAGTSISGATVVATALANKSNSPAAQNKTAQGQGKTSISTNSNATNTLSNTLSGGVNTVSAGGTSSTSGTSGTSTSGSSSNSLTSNASSEALLQATNQMQEMNQTFNLQYLQLQENMQSENRDFTSVSNVMKIKSDTAKNSISNLK